LPTTSIALESALRPESAVENAEIISIFSCIYVFEVVVESVEFVFEEFVVVDDCDPAALLL
jgi:hypothetical protein